MTARARAHTLTCIANNPEPVRERLRALVWVRRHCHVHATHAVADTAVVAAGRTPIPARTQPTHTQHRGTHTLTQPHRTPTTLLRGSDDHGGDGGVRARAAMALCPTQRPAGRVLQDCRAAPGDGWGPRHRAWMIAYYVCVMMSGSWLSLCRV